MNMKKMFLLNLPYLLFVYPFDKLAQAFRLAPGADLSGKLLSIGGGFTAALSSPWLSFHPTDLLIGIAGAVILRMAVYLKGKNAKKYRHGIEYGSARWGTAADIAPYMDKDFFQNIPMTQTERITMASRPKQPKYARNKNILVIGGSGSGKTRFFCKPSLLQAHSSYVCTDPKGTLLPEIGTFLERKKYRIKCLNLINFRKSMRYNPLAYIRSEKDILKLVNALIMNTKGEGEKSSEDFWVKAERLYYSALIGYIWYEATEEEKNFITLLDLINASEAREDDETYQSPVDLLFSQLEEREPDHFAVKQYRKFKMAAGVVCSKRLLNQAVGKSLRTHNLKPKKGAQVMRKNEKITALYERLSRDDFGKDDDQQRESNSISNQKAMLEEFAARQGFTNIVHFTDDGISGTCFDRPGFLAMMKEVEAGNVEYLCIKDMSRMGRDYLKVGQIMEILRQRGVRLIAINDGVDSARGDDDFTPFRNIMNEYYARDTSRKIRSTFQSKGKSGKHLTGTVIYGYLWNEARDQWLVDPEAAEVVKRIFAMTIDGYGPYQIASKLKEEKVLIPSAYLAQHGEGVNKTQRKAGAYSQKGKISNLKEMNETFNYLRANGIYNLEDLESRVNEHSSTTESLKKTLDGQTARMKEIKQLYDSSAAFQNLKPVYDGLQKIKFEKPRAKYKAEHEAELIQFYAARRKLTGEFPDGKVDMKKLSDEYDELEQAHETTYGEFKAVRDDLHRLWKVKSCVDTAARFNERTEEQKLQNRPQTRHKKEELSR